MSLTLEQKLKALKALKTVYKAVLNEWLSDHLVKGTKYTYLVRPETLDDYGYTHLHERVYCKPQVIKYDGQLSSSYDFLPILTFKQMDRLFAKEGLASVDWKHLSENWRAMDRLVDYINEDYRRNHGR